MERFVPIEKQSKKAQKAHNARQRGDWQGVRPCTLTFADRKKYSKSDRSRQKAALRAAF